VTTLGDYLKKQGFSVNDSDVPYGRDTTWEKVKWLFVHHTADSDDPSQSAARAHYIKTASGRYPPLAQIMLGRDQKVYICAKQRSGQAEPGRASHAGEGIYSNSSGSIPRDCGNQMSLGIEVQCSGAHPLSHHKDSYATLINLLASLCRRYGLDQARVIGHKEYSSTGKIDPKDDCQQIRRDVKAALAGPQEETVDYFNFGIVEPMDLPDDVWTRVKFTKDSSDDGGWHKEGNAGVYITEGVINCSAIIRIKGNGRIEARIARAPSGSVSGDGQGTVMGGPFTGEGTVTIFAPPFNGSDQGVFVEIRPASDAVLDYIQFRGTVSPRG